MARFPAAWPVATRPAAGRTWGFVHCFASSVQAPYSGRRRNSIFNYAPIHLAFQFYSPADIRHQLKGPQQQQLSRCRNNISNLHSNRTFTLTFENDDHSDSGRVKHAAPSRARLRRPGQTRNRSRRRRDCDRYCATAQTFAI